MLVRPVHPVALRPPHGPPPPRGAFVMGPAPVRPAVGSMSPRSPPVPAGYPSHTAPVRVGFPHSPPAPAPPTVETRPPLVYRPPQHGPGFPDGPARAVVLVDGPPHEDRRSFQPGPPSGRPPPPDTVDPILLPPTAAHSASVRQVAPEILPPPLLVPPKGPRGPGQPSDNRRTAGEESGGPAVFLAPATDRVPSRPVPYADDRRGPPPPASGPVLSLQPGPGARRPLRERAHLAGPREGDARAPPPSYGRDGPARRPPEGFPRRPGADFHQRGELRPVGEPDLQPRGGSPRLEFATGPRPPPRAGDTCEGMVKGPFQEPRGRPSGASGGPILLSAVGDGDAHSGTSVDRGFCPLPREERAGDMPLRGGDMPPRGADMPSRGGGMPSKGATMPPQGARRDAEGRPPPGYDPAAPRGYSSPPDGSGCDRSREGERGSVLRGPCSDGNPLSPENGRGLLVAPGRPPLRGERERIPPSYKRDSGGIFPSAPGTREGGHFLLDSRDREYAPGIYPYPESERGRPVFSPAGQDRQRLSGPEDERMGLHAERERPIFGHDRERGGGNVPPPSALGSFSEREAGSMQPAHRGDEGGADRFRAGNGFPTRYPCDSGRGSVPPGAPGGGRRGVPHSLGERERGPMRPPEFEGDPCGQGPRSYFQQGGQGRSQDFSRPFQEPDGDFRREGAGQRSVIFHGGEGGPLPGGPMRRGERDCSSQPGAPLRSEGGNVPERRESFHGDQMYASRGFPPYGCQGEEGYLNNENEWKRAGNSSHRSFGPGDGPGWHPAGDAPRTFAVQQQGLSNTARREGPVSRDSRKENTCAVNRNERRFSPPRGVPFDLENKPAGADCAAGGAGKEPAEASREATSTKPAADAGEPVAEGNELQNTKESEGGETGRLTENSEQGEAARKTDGGSASASVSLAGGVQEEKPGQCTGTGFREGGQRQDPARSGGDGDKSAPRAGTSNQPLDKSSQKEGSASSQSQAGKRDESQHNKPADDLGRRGRIRDGLPAAAAVLPPSRNAPAATLGSAAPGNRNENSFSPSDNSLRVFPPPGDTPPSVGGQGPASNIAGEGTVRGSAAFGGDPGRGTGGQPAPSLLGKGGLLAPPSRCGTRLGVMNARDERPRFGEDFGPPQNGRGPGGGGSRGGGPPPVNSQGICGGRPTPDGRWIQEAGESAKDVPRNGPLLRPTWPSDQGGSTKNSRPPFAPQNCLDPGGVGHDARGPPGYLVPDQEAPPPPGTSPGSGDNSDRLRGLRGPFSAPRGVDGPFLGPGTHDGVDRPDASNDRFAGPVNEQERNKGVCGPGMPPFSDRSGPERAGPRPPGNWGGQGLLGPPVRPPRDAGAGFGSSSFQQRAEDRGAGTGSSSAVFCAAAPFQGDRGCNGVSVAGAPALRGGRSRFSGCESKGSSPNPSQAGGAKSIPVPPFSRGEDGPLTEKNRMLGGPRSTDENFSCSRKTNACPPPPPPPPPPEQPRNSLTGFSGPSGAAPGGAPGNSAGPATAAPGLFSALGPNQMSPPPSSDQGRSTALQSQDPFQALLLMQAAAGGGGGNATLPFSLDKNQGSKQAAAPTDSRANNNVPTPLRNLLDTYFPGGGASADLQQFCQQLQAGNPQLCASVNGGGNAGPPAGGGLPGSFSQQTTADAYAAALSALLAGQGSTLASGSRNEQAGSQASTPGMSPNQLFEQLQKMMLGKQTLQHLAPQALTQTVVGNPNFLGSLAGRGGGCGQQPHQPPPAFGGSGTRPTGTAVSSSASNSAFAWGTNSGPSDLSTQWQALASQLFGRPDLMPQQQQQQTPVAPIPTGTNPLQQLFQQAHQQQFNSTQNKSAPPDTVSQNTQVASPKTQAGHNPGGFQAPDALVALMSQGLSSFQQTPQNQFVRSIVQAMGGGTSGPPGGAGQPGAPPAASGVAGPGTGQSSGDAQQNAFWEMLKHMGFCLPQPGISGGAQAAGGNDSSNSSTKSAPPSKDDKEKAAESNTPSRSRLLQELDKVDPAMLNPSSNREAHTWWYLDNSNQCQGPFDTLQMLRWLEGGFFDPQRPLRRDDEAGFTPLADGKRLTEAAARIINTSRQPMGPAVQGQTGTPFPFLGNASQIFSSPDMSLEAKVQHAQVALAPLFMMAKKQQQQGQDRQQLPLFQNKRRKFQ